MTNCAVCVRCGDNASRPGSYLCAGCAANPACAGTLEYASCVGCGEDAECNSDKLCGCCDDE
jgi:hypothetical protein